MTSPLRKVLGLTIIIISIAGLILNGVGLVKIWQLREPATNAIKDNIELLNGLLDTSSEMLVIVESTLKTATNELIFLESSLLTINEFIQDADPLLNSIQNLTGENLPNTLGSIQESLKTAQQSADVIDTVLKAFSSIPFFPGEPYDPDIPLSESLKRIGDNLASINPSLEAIKDNIITTKANLSELNVDISLVVSTTKQTRSNLKDAQKVILGYQEHVETAQMKIKKAQENTANVVTSIVWILTFTIVWLAFAQLGLLVQGVQLFFINKQD